MERKLKAVMMPVLGLALLLGCLLRFVGLTRGDFEAGGDFHHFHPDQWTLIEAAQQLDSPLDPPLTAYGLLPMYLAAGALEVGSTLSGDSVDLTTTAGQRLAVVSVRTLSASLSCLTLWLLWSCGRRYFGRAAAAIAVLVMAVVPVAVQQAHFYTVDGVFTLLAVAVIYATFAAVERDDWRHYLLCGALVGAAGAVRLNGLLSGLILLGAHLARPAVGEPAGHFGRTMARVRNPHLWLSGLAAVAVLAAIQPYLIADPARLTQSLTPDDLAYSMRLARGEFLRVWSLVDVHTVPYLHFWTDLWPTGVGWPLTLAFLVSIGHALWRPQLHTSLLLLWLALYFIPVGGLHTKHVRYLLPMLPFLGLLFGDTLGKLATAGGPRLLRHSIGVVSAIIIAHAGAYGIAFARIYHVEDSRIQARRWLDDNLPQRARIAVEHGGFSMQGVLPSQRYRTGSLNMGLIFGSRGYLSCQATSRILQHQLAAADVAIITDVNRYRQFTAVPELFPVVAAFYTDLVGGALGFDLTRRFKVYPRLAGFTFEDDDAEPSFIGYDHPAVLVLSKADSFSDQSWHSWQERFHADHQCAHGALVAIAAARTAGNLETALQRTRVLQQAHAQLRFPAMIEAYLLHQLQRPGQAAAAAERYGSGYGDASIAPYLIAPATAITLTSAGLDDLGLAVLEEAAQRKDQFAGAALAPMARAYGTVAQLQQRDGKPELAYDIHLLAARLHPAAESFNALAGLSSDRGDYERALESWDQSLHHDSAQVSVHRRVARAAFAEADYERVIDHLQQVLEQQPEMGTRKRRDTLNLLGALSDSTGQYDRAQEFWRASLSLNGDQAQIHRDLGLLLVRQNAAVSQSLMHLEKAVELAPSMRVPLGDAIARLRAGHQR